MTGATPHRRLARTTLAVVVAACATAAPASAQVPKIPLQDVISGQYQQPPAASAVVP